MQTYIPHTIAEIDRSKLVFDKRITKNIYVDLTLLLENHDEEFLIDASYALVCGNVLPADEDLWENFLNPPRGVSFSEGREMTLFFYFAALSSFLDLAFNRKRQWRSKSLVELSRIFLTSLVKHDDDRKHDAAYTSTNSTLTADKLHRGRSMADRWVAGGATEDEARIIHHILQKPDENVGHLFHILCAEDQIAILDISFILDADKYHYSYRKSHTLVDIGNACLASLKRNFNG